MAGQRSTATLLALLLACTLLCSGQRANRRPIMVDELFRNTAEWFANQNNAAAAPTPAAASAPAAGSAAWNNPTTLSKQQAVTLTPYAPTAPTAYELQATAEASATAAAATASLSLPSSDFNERASDVIAYNVLRFAHDVIGQQLVESGGRNNYEIFSPVSVVSSLALLMLGARGRSYQELRQLLGADSDESLRSSPSAFHREFGNMLEDVQLPIGGGRQQSPPRQRQPANWRNTPAIGNIRGSTAAERNKPYEHIIKLANGLFAQKDYDLNLIYTGLSRQIYGSNLMRLDFHHNAHYASSYINDWVRNKTYGKIANIVDDDFPRDTNVVLANALYFKGFWENSFFDGATTYEDFFPDGQQYAPVKVKMMGTGGIFPFYDATEYDCRIIGLPYKGNQTTMYVIQPNQSSRTKLWQLHQSLDAYKIESMIARMEQKSALLAFPKMHFQRSLNMKKILRNLNLNDIFAREHSDLSLIAHVGNAPYTPTAPRVTQRVVPRGQQTTKATGEQPFIFSRSGAFAEMEASSQTTEDESSRTKRSVPEIGRPQIDRRNGLLELLENQRIEYSYSKPDLYVEDILHKVDFEVNEQGTEAAAATLTYLRRSGTSVLFRADSPFLVLIRHDPTKLVLFYGLINQPE